jgi:plastocyanin
MHRSRPMAIAGITLSLLLALAACSSGNGGASTAASQQAASEGAGASEPAAPSEGGATDNTVSLAGNRFSPGTLTIPVGTTVTFTDTSGHTVTEGTDGTAVDDPIVDEGGGADIEVTFDEAGIYTLTCKVHPEMRITITVQG